MSDTHLSPEKIMQLGMGFWASKALLSAVELELFSELAKQPEDFDAFRGVWVFIHEALRIFWMSW